METFREAFHRLRGEQSLRDVARLAHLNAGHLSRIAAGKRPPTQEMAAALDEALHTDGQLLALVVPQRWEMDGGLWRPKDSERLAAVIAGTTPTAENAIELAHQWLTSEPPQVYEVRSGRRIGERTVREVETRVHKLRLLDDHVGGTDTYTLVTDELDATNRLLKGAAYTEDVGRRLLVAVGELCQLSGWTSSDAGRYADAERIYLAGVVAAHAGGDRAGAANNLSSLAYQVANIGDRREAATLARSAYAGARKDATATARALLAERVAWTAARTGEVGGAERALGAVEEAYADRKPADDPAWVYWLDEDEIEIMAGRVWTQLRRPLRAVPILEKATAGYGEDTGRETALYLTWLAESLAQANEPERAADAAARALRLARRAGSVRAADRVKLVRKQLAKFRGNAAVDAFEDEACA